MPTFVSPIGPLTRYAFAVLAPVAAGVLGGLWFSASALDRFQEAADARIAAAATDLIWQEMGRAREALLEEAEAVEATPPYGPAVEAALRGDTVVALGSSDQGLELTVVYGDGPLVRIATTAFQPTVLETLPSISRYRLALYLRGKRTMTTNPAFSPLQLDPKLHMALSRRPEGMPFSLNGSSAAIRPFQPVPGHRPEVVVVAAPEEQLEQRTARTTAPVTVLVVVLLLSAFAAWTIYRPPPEEPALRGERSSLQWPMVVLIPVIAGIAILLAFNLGFRRATTGGLRDQLNRAVVLTRQIDVTESVSAAQTATRFDVARVRAGAVEAATTDDDAVLEALRTLRPPPPGWTSSGVLDLKGGLRLYAAARTPSGAALVLIGPDLLGRFHAVRIRLGLWALLVIVPPVLFLWLSQRPPLEPTR